MPSTTLCRSVSPGSALDLAGFVRAMDADGCTAPLGAEIWSSVLAEQPPCEVARRVGDALRALATAARGDRGAGALAAR